MLDELALRLPTYSYLATISRVVRMLLSSKLKAKHLTLIDFIGKYTHSNVICNAFISIFKLVRCIIQFAERRSQRLGTSTAGWSIFCGSPCAKMDRHPSFLPEYNYNNNPPASGSSSLLTNQAAQQIASQLVAPKNILHIDPQSSASAAQLPFHPSSRIVPASAQRRYISNGMDKRHPSSFQQLEKVFILPIESYQFTRTDQDPSSSAKGPMPPYDSDSSCIVYAESI